jgi:hypothetical protein
MCVQDIAVILWLTDVVGVDHLQEILACKKNQHSHNILLGTTNLQ